MNLYVIRNNEYDYDEFGGWVVSAKTKKRAKKIVEPNLHSDHLILKIGTTHYKTEKVILSDFHAG